MKNKYKSSRGFAMAEVIIAIAVIGIISLAAVSLFTSSINSTKRAMDKAEAQNVLESVVECYRVSESGENFDNSFNSALAFTLDLDSADYKENITKDDTTVSISLEGTLLKVSVTVGEQTVSADYDKGGALQ